MMMATSNGGDLFNGWPEDGEPVSTMSDEEMVEWCNKTQDTIIAQRKEIERLKANAVTMEEYINDIAKPKIERLEAVMDAAGEYLYDTSKRDVLQKAYIAALEGGRDASCLDSGCEEGSHKPWCDHANPIPTRDRIMALLSPPSQDVHLTVQDARWIKAEIERLEKK